MKIKDKDYQHIKTSLQSAINTIGLPNVMEHKAKLVSGEIKCQNENARLMYDLAHRAGLIDFVVDVIYKYADDTHYKTALLKAGRELNLI